MPLPPVDPEIGLVLARVAGHWPVPNRDNLAELRGRQLLARDAVVLSDQVERIDHTVPGPPGAPEVVLRTHVPAGIQGGAPCLYYIHGGGYILGHRYMDDLRFDRWCPKMSFIGVSVEHRQGPETPYPGPLEDCYAGLKWVFDNATELGIDQGRIGIGGASAGGGLAAALALLAHDRGGPPVAFQMLAYPMIDDRQITESSRWQVPIWGPANNEFGWRSYLGELYGSDEIPPHAAPARALDLAGLPPALIYVGTLDGLCDESVFYAMRLYQSGVPTELQIYPGAPHGFDSFAPDAEISVRCQRNVQGWLLRALETPRG